MKNNNFTELKINDYFKVKNTGFYYEVKEYLKTANLFKCKRICGKGRLLLFKGKINEVVETIYNTEDEKNIIRERIKKEENGKKINELKKLDIDIDKFKDMTRIEKYEIINKKDISDKKKLDLVNYNYDKVQKEIKTTMSIAVKSWADGSKGLVKCAKNMIKMSAKFKESINVIKHCCFCREIEEEMIQGKNGYYAHSACLEKARKELHGEDRI